MRSKEQIKAEAISYIEKTSKHVFYNPKNRTFMWVERLPDDHYKVVYVERTAFTDMASFREGVTIKSIAYKYDMKSEHYLGRYFFPNELSHECFPPSRKDKYHAIRQTEDIRKMRREYNESLVAK